jgi:hypothetical protein
MNKRKTMNYLTEQFQGKKVTFGNHDFEVIINDKTYYIVFIKVGSNAQLTVNSPTHFEVVVGKLDGIRFIKRQSTLYDFTEFSYRTNKIVYLLGTPFRMLQYLNESDIIDITGQKSVHGYNIFTSVKDFDTL